MAAAGVAYPAFGPRFTDPSRLIAFLIVSFYPPTLADSTTSIYSFHALNNSKQVLFRLLCSAKPVQSGDSSRLPPPKRGHHGHGPVPSYQDATSENCLHWYRSDMTPLGKIEHADDGSPLWKDSCWLKDAASFSTVEKSLCCRSIPNLLLRYLVYFG